MHREIRLLMAGWGGADRRGREADRSRDLTSSAVEPPASRSRGLQSWSRRSEVGGGEAFEMVHGDDRPALRPRVEPGPGLVVLGALALGLVFGRDPNPDADSLSVCVVEVVLRGLDRGRAPAAFPCPRG